MSYTEKLEATKATYPFDRWQEAFEDGLEQYTEENCNLVKAVFDELVDGLKSLGENASEADKIALFKKAVLSLNDLNDEIDGLIETGEREDLWELINQVTIAANLNPDDYGEGEGLASEWREW